MQTLYLDAAVMKRGNEPFEESLKNQYKIQHANFYLDPALL